MQSALIAGRSQTADCFLEFIHRATWEGIGSVVDCGSIEFYLAANDAVNVTQRRRTPVYQYSHVLLIWREHLLAEDRATKLLRLGIQP